jgi:p-aminobenzoyl-glutamate transporter AbgT
MYFSTHQYPWIRSLPKTEQKAAMSDIYKKERRYVWRFFAVVVSLIVFVPLVARLFLNNSLAEWSPLIVGVAFYMYMIWEINGPLYRAAKRHFEAPKSGALENERNS